MKIQIKELGAIKEATIDLNKPLTIFCGLNGTGKTYLANAIYAITSEKNKSIGIPLSEEVKKNLLENNLATLEIDIEELWNYRNKEILTIKQNLWKLFAVSESKADVFFNKTEINILETFDEFSEKIKRLYFKDFINILDYSFEIYKQSMSLKIEISLLDNTIKNQDLINTLNYLFISRLYSFIAYFPISSSTIFPVERNSIYTFSSELSLKKNETFDQIQNLINKKEVNLIDVFKRKARYPQPIIDCLAVAEQLDIVQKRKSIFNIFAEEIEKDLLCGKVSLNKDTGEVQFISDKAKLIPLSFHQSSSIVKTLASLVIYLKYIAIPNDLIIIDEPELNLHPENQIKLTRVFAKLINIGLRLIISTHSDYIIRELNNLVMLSNKSPEISDLANKLQYSESEKIHLNDISVYMFKFKYKKDIQVIVNEIKVEETGFEVSTFDNTIDELNKKSEELYYTIKYGKH